MNINDNTIALQSILNNTQSSSGYLPTSAVVQTSGQSESLVMSQKAVTDLAMKGATVVQAPTFVDSVDEMIDTSKVYILNSTGTIWAYKDGGTSIQTVTEQIEGTSDNPWSAGRLSSGNPNGLAGYVTTPYIDLQKYSVPFTLHLGGITFSYKDYGSATQTYLRWSHYKTDKTHIITELTQASAFGPDYWNNAATLTDVGDGSVEIAFTPPLATKSGVEIGYVRFSGYGTEADADVYITYEGEVSGGKAWIDTGVVYGGNEIVEDITEFTLTNPSVKAFMESADYNDNDYSYTNVNSYTSTDFYRKDLPFPIILKWAKNENAVQYVVSLNDGELTYYTENNTLSIWNLIPNKIYSFKVHAFRADGSTMLIKSGNFSTTSEQTRFLNIDGIQNVRDIGGYTVGSQKVKYGLLYRGSAMDEAIGSALCITDAGKQEMVAKVGIKTDLDLRGLNNVTESALGNSVDFYAPQWSYLNYVNAITDTTAKGAFKTMLEYINAQLTANKPVYIHCSGGCDRTATLVFLLLGLLGVSESDLAKEYELSSFAPIGTRSRTRNSTVYDYKGMVAAIKGYSGSTLTAKFESFAVDCGVSNDTITAFRNLMLG